jgi:ABC-2 type transport system permease protein
MKNILLVLKREYLTRVKKKSFIIMTFLTPLLLAGMMIIPAWLATREGTSKRIEVIDESGLFEGKFKNAKELVFIYSSSKTLEKAKADLKTKKADVIAFIPKEILTNGTDIKIFAEKNVSLELKMKIENIVENEIENIKLLEAGLTQKILESTKANISSQTLSIDEEGEKNSSSIAATAIGYGFAFAIYMAIFLYGSQVMRGVMEEKQSRIVEVIISSVKPFQLMMGKIIGIALVGMTQFLLWITLTLTITTATTAILGSNPRTEMIEKTIDANKEMKEAKAKAQLKLTGQSMIDDSMAAIKTLNWPLILGSFLIYFLGGYLLYASYFAAIGSAVDSDTDIQQFMIPVTIPLVLAIIMAQFVLSDPDGQIAFWGSMIPLTSPILMMVRLPFGVPTWQLVLSISLLILSFIGMVKLSAKIYKVGILMYGKKVTLKEISKWLFYKGY